MIRDWTEFKAQLPENDLDAYASRCPLHKPLWDIIFSPSPPSVIVPARLVIPTLESVHLLAAQSMPSVLFREKQPPVHYRRLEDTPIIRVVLYGIFVRGL